MQKNYLLHLNIFKTLYVNFKLLPFKQALHMPILLYGKVNVSNCTGRVIINRPLQFGMLRFGISRGGFYGTRASSYSRFCVEGTLILNEVDKTNGIKRSQFSHDSCLHIGQHGTLILNEYEDFGPRCNIACYEMIEVGSWLSTSWDVQVFDTNFHFLISNEGKVHRATKPIKVGNHCWIGNRTTLNPGAKISDYTTIASNSLVNKDFSDFQRVILGGVPSVVLREGYRRIFSFAEEKRLFDFFAKYHNDETIIENINIL